MSDNPFLESVYAFWLQMHFGHDKIARYSLMFSLLHSLDFFWVVGNDENRIADGRALRIEYQNAASDHSFATDHQLNFYPVSFLEVVVGIAKRMAFLTASSVQECAWQRLTVLGLHNYPDAVDTRKFYEIRDIVEKVLWRRYLPTGNGGFFPLRMYHEKDQTTVEIWDQMNAYIIENHM